MTHGGLGATLARTREGILLALDSVRANKARAALTILGVGIGVMVVIAMASTITGVNRGVTQRLETLGPRTFFVWRFFREGIQVSDGSDEMSPWRRNPWMTVEEAELIRQLPLVRDVTVREASSGQVVHGDITLDDVSVRGMTPSWVTVVGGSVVDGRNFTPAEQAAGARVMVINEKLADELFPGLDPIGKRAKVFGEPFEVVGKYAEPASLFGSGDSPVVIMPHGTFTKVAQYWKGWLQVAVVPVEYTTVAETQDQVISALRAARGLRAGQENNFAVVGQDRLLANFNNVTGAFFVVMLALSSIGLLVGGVGVIAIMMISVTERTREIGVRKALGATRAEIMFQFLVEAATLTLLGGITGMVLGGLIAWGVASWTPIPAVIPLWSVVVALLASAVTGIFFGLYPASRAARLDPVEALRYE